MLGPKNLRVLGPGLKSAFKKYPVVLNIAFCDQCVIAPEVKVALQHTIVDAFHAIDHIRICHHPEKKRRDHNKWNRIINEFSHLTGIHYTQMHRRQ